MAENLQDNTHIEVLAFADYLKEFGQPFDRHLAEYKQAFLPLQDAWTEYIAMHGVTSDNFWPAADLINESRPQLAPKRSVKEEKESQASSSAREDLAHVIGETPIQDAFDKIDELQFQRRQNKLRQKENLSLITTAAGLMGLAACTAATYFESRVATTALQHAERGGVVVVLATLGWGSVAATGGCAFFAWGYHLDRQEERDAHKEKLL